MKRIAPGVILAFCLLVLQIQAKAQQDYFEIKVYHLQNPGQQQALETFFHDTGIPAMHEAGVTKVGVFKPIATDTSRAGKLLFVFIPYRSLSQFEMLEKRLQQTQLYSQSPYFNSPYDQPAFLRVESILMKAFSGMTSFDIPKLSGPAGDRIYELRSYESASEKFYVNKVKMFNDGDEIGLFRELGFNAVFYAEVLSGAHMPNLMYMTSFNNITDREEHWKKFFAHPRWKTLVSLKEYQHNVSHADIYLLNPSFCSEL